MLLSKDWRGGSTHSPFWLTYKECQCRQESEPKHFCAGCETRLSIRKGAMPSASLPPLLPYSDEALVDEVEAVAAVAASGRGAEALADSDEDGSDTNICFPRATTSHRGFKKVVEAPDGESSDGDKRNDDDSGGSDHPSCDRGNGGSRFYGPHPGRLFQREVVRPEKRLRPFVGTNEQLRKLTRARGLGGGRNDAKHLSQQRASDSGAVSTLGGKRRISSLVDGRFLGASASERGRNGMRSSFLLPPVDGVRRGSVAGGQQRRRRSMLTVAARPSSAGAATAGQLRRRSSSAPPFPRPSTAAVAIPAMHGNGRKIPDVLSCGLRELPDMSPAQTNDSNISAGLREYAAGNYGAALSRLSRAVEQHERGPSAFVPRFVRGLCHDRLGRSEAARRDFALCCGRDAWTSRGGANSGGKDIGTSSGAGSGIGSAAAATGGGGGDYDRHRSLAYFNRGVVRAKTNDLSGALDDFTTAINMNPSSEPSFYANRALLHRRNGDFEAAQRDYRLLRRVSEGQRGGGGDHRQQRSGAASATTMASPSRRQATIIVRPATPGGDRHRHKHPAAASVASPVERTAAAGQISPAIRKRPRPGSFPPATATTPLSNSSSSEYVDPHATVFGHVHGALTCPAQKRTAVQLDTLVRESESMSAFVRIDRVELRTLWRYLEYRTFPSNVRIFEQDDPAEDYYLVWAGSVSARVRKENGAIRHANIAKALALETEFTVNTMTAGETLGEAVLEDGGFRKATCVTEEPTELLVLKKEHFDMTWKKFLQREHEEKVDFLGGIACFSGWERETLSRAAKYCRERTYREGEVIVCQDAPADSIFFIRSGLVSLLRMLTVDMGGEEEELDDDNRPFVDNERTEEEQEDDLVECEVCVAKICAGDVFGEATVLDPQDGRSAFPSSAVCETQTVCYRLDRVQIESSGEWDDNTRAALRDIAVSYPEDAILLQAHIDHLQFKKRSSQIMKKFWSKQDPNKRSRRTR